MTVDPLAERHFDWSAYNYVLNSPLNRFDPDGRTDFLSRLLNRDKNPFDVHNLNYTASIDNIQRTSSVLSADISERVSLPIYSSISVGI